MAYTSTTISGWDNTKPDGSAEYPAILDDAVREVKTCVENDGITQGNLSGTDLQLQNAAGTVKDTVALASVGASAFAAGTKMLFRQTAAPTGWTKDTTYNNYMLRVVTGTISQGGSHSPILMDKVPSHTHTFTSGNQSASHTHTYNDMAQLYDATAGVNTNPDPSGFGQVKNTGTQSANHTHSGTSDANASASNWTPYYIDTIIATKD